MDVSATSSVLNASFSQTVAKPADNATPNAFGIGEANQPKVELSAQARILQQAEQNQQARQQNTEPRRQEKDDEANQGIDNNFVRVSSSVGQSSQSNNLSSEKATELYRSIEKLL